MKPVGRHGNRDRYSVDPGDVASVATGKPRYATASRIQKWSHDGVHGSPSRQNTDSTENPHPTRIW